MIYMKKQTIIMGAIILLLLANLGMMAFFWSVPKGEKAGRRGSPEGRRAEVAAFMSQELQLTESQQQAFQTMRAAFFEQSRGLRRDIRTARREFYAHIMSNDEASAQAQADLIAEKQKELEMTTFYHFRDLRSQLSAEQQENFDEVMAEMLNARWVDGPRRGRGPRQGRER
jgi:periplasmic protein CpxP/Spy